MLGLAALAVAVYIVAVRDRLSRGVVGGLLLLGCGAERVDAPELARAPEVDATVLVEADVSARRYAAGVHAALWRALGAEVGAGRRAVYAPLAEKRMPWVDVAAGLRCFGRACADACVAELRLDGTRCATGQGRGTDVITVIAAGCGDERVYAYEVAYDPPALRDAPEPEVLPSGDDG